MIIATNMAVVVQIGAGGSWQAEVAALEIRPQSKLKKLKPTGRYVTMRYWQQVA
ncbi:hypothetical protein ACNKHU_00660 [Shigella flexneri]